MLVAGKDRILELLLGTIPFENDDPLHASSNGGQQQSAASARDKERWQLSCDLLAQSIIKRVYAHIQEESESLEHIKRIKEGCGYGL